MAKEKAAEAAAVPTMTVRKFLYRGPSGRGWLSVPFGETRVFRAGQTYEVGESYAYLWKDLQFAAWFEWQGEPIEVPAINEGQVPPPS